MDAGEVSSAGADPTAGDMDAVNTGSGLVLLLAGATHSAAAGFDSTLGVGGGTGLAASTLATSTFAGSAFTGSTFAGTTLGTSTGLDGAGVDLGSDLATSVF